MRPRPIGGCVQEHDSYCSTEVFTLEALDVCTSFKLVVRFLFLNSLRQVCESGGNSIIPSIDLVQFLVGLVKAIVGDKVDR
jgi:hypothetical protein